MNTSTPSTQPTRLQKTRSWVGRHRVLSGFIVLVVGIAAWRIVHGITVANQPTSYVLGTVQTGTIVESVSGTGQISASNKVDLSPKTSGTLVYLNAKVGQSVQQGQLIGQVDAQTASYDLQTAKLSYDKLVTIDPVTLQDDQNAVASASAAARATLTSSVTDMSDVLTQVDSLFTGYLSPSTQGVSNLGRSYEDRANTAYYTANKALQEFQKTYRGVSVAMTDDQVQATLDTENAIAGQIVQAAKYTQDAVTYNRSQDTNAKDTTTADAAYTTITSALASANSIVSKILSAKTSLTNAHQTLTTLTDGPAELDVRSAQASLSAKQDAYNNTMVVAPFAGVIASVPVTVGDTVSSSTTVVTLITKQKVVDLSLNEIDAAKVVAGDKVTLTFDAIDGLTLTGQVISVDLVGTVSQGVVSYDVKIGLDTDDDRVKPGMTVSANIITNTAADVLTVPTSAVTTKNGVSTVQVVDDATVASLGTASASGVVLPTAPNTVEVTTGLSDNASVQILSGLTEGQHIVVKKVAASATSTTTAAAPSILGSTTRTGGGGGAGAFIGR